MPLQGQGALLLGQDRNHVFEDIVWTYPDPIPEHPKIKDYLCFFNEHVDDIFVDGVAQPRPVTPWSKNWKRRRQRPPISAGRC